MKLFPSFAALVTFLLCATAALAEPLNTPKGKILLTVSGKISNTNAGQTAQFDRDMLEGLGMIDVVTTTPWHDGKVKFTGVSLKRFLQAVGAQGETLKAYALNDYESQIPLIDAEDEDVILAIKLNGADMEIRNKGPIFIVYPYDSRADYHTQTYYARSAWQVVRMSIE